MGVSESGPAKRTRAENARLCSRRRRLSSRVLFAGRRMLLGGTDWGRRRMARKGACSSIGKRSSGGRAGRSSDGTGGSGVAGGPCNVLSRRMYVDFTNFEDVLIFWVPGTEYLECVPEGIVLIQEGIGGHDDAVAQGPFFEAPSDDVGARVR